MNGLRSKIQHIHQLASAPDTLDDAVRMSAEILAGTDDSWSALQRAGKARSTELYDMMTAGTAHVDCLFRAGLHADAFATAALLQMPPVIDDALTDNAVSLMALNALAYVSLMALMDRMTDDETTRAHVHAIARYLCSMLYASYAQVKEAAEDGHTLYDANRWLPLAHDILADAIHAGLVEWPRTDVNGTGADCMEQRGIIVGDLLGRARALGLMHG